MAAFVALLFSALLTGCPQDPPPSEPTRIEWQRTLTDALAVQQATGLPLLIAVNMNGEVFNERFANTTYHDPAFIESTRGYVCVVASPDRHTERDYDAFGNRVECPRFGGCTCSEHIAIEPELFARFFNGTRNAPRHVAAGKNGKVLFDRFLDQSMETAIDAIQQHRGKAKAEAVEPTDNLVELFRRRDARSRRAVEGLWKRGDFDQKRQLLEAAADATNEPNDLLRAALRTDDATLFAYAAMALSKTGGKDALIDLEDALARIDDPALTKALVARITEIGKTDKAAARLASHFVLATEATVAKPWSNPWQAATYDASDRLAVEGELDRCEAALRQNKTDEETRLHLAIAQLALADILIRDTGKGIEMWFGDALSNAKKIKDEALKAEAQAVIAYSAYMTSDYKTATVAMALAQSSVKSERQPSPFLAARLLETVLFATSNAVYADAEAATRSQGAEIARTLAMIELLRTRKVAREPALLSGIGLLEFGGRRRDARTLLAEAAALFPASPTSHERWRNRLLVDLGAEGMRKAYSAHVTAAADKPVAEWFAGYAALLAGDQHTRDERAVEAIAAYSEAIERFATCAAGNAEFADSAQHFSVLALAGRAELANARGNCEEAAADLLRANELRPASLDASDGLQRKPRAIADRIAAALEKAGKAELAAKLKPLLL